MDPVSIVGITSAACSISASITKLFCRLDTLRRKFEDAEFTLNLLKRRLKAVQLALDVIASWATHATGIQCSRQLCDTLIISLDGCNAVLGCLNDYAGEFCGKGPHVGFADKSKFIWKEDTMKEFLDHLNSEILVLNLVLTTYHCHNLSEQEDLLQLESSRQAIQTLSKDTRSLQTLVDSRSVSVESSRRSTWTGIEKEFAFDNVLINTHTYRESLASLRRKESSTGASSTKPYEHPTLPADLSVEPPQKKSEPDFLKPNGRKSIDWLRRLFRRRSTTSSMQQSANVISQPPLPLKGAKPLAHQTLEQCDQETHFSLSSPPSIRDDVVNQPVPDTTNKSRRFGTLRDPNKALSISNKSPKDLTPDHLDQILLKANSQSAKGPISPLAKVEHYFENANSLLSDSTDAISLNNAKYFHMKGHSSTSDRTGGLDRGDGDESDTIFKVNRATAGPSKRTYSYADSILSQRGRGADPRHKRYNPSTTKHSKELRSRGTNTPSLRMETLDEEPACHNSSAVHESISSTVKSSSEYLEGTENNNMATKSKDLSGLKQFNQSNFVESVGSRRSLPSARSDKVQHQTKGLEVTQDNDERRKSHPEASSNGHSNENEHRKMPGRPGELIPNYTNSVRYSGLHGAASAGDRNGIRNFLDKGVDIDEAWPGSRFTALHCAAREGHVAAVAYILDRGAAVNAIDANHHTALHHACALGRARVANALWRKSFSVDILETADRHGHTALFMCRSEADSVFRLLLLRLGADFRAQDIEGSTPLHWYAYIGDLRKVDVLLKRGAPYEITTKFGRTVFHSACCGGDVDVVLRLLQENVNIESEDRSLRRPLHSASSFGHLAVVKLLLSKGASPFMKDRSNRTPLSIVRCKLTESYQYKAIGDLLLEHMRKSK